MLAVARDDLLVEHHAHDAVLDLLGVVQDRAWDLPRGQVAIVVVQPIAEALSRQRQLELERRGFHLRSRERDIDDVPVDCFDRAPDREADLEVLRRHIVEGSVRLQVADLGPGISGHALERADLVGDHVFQVAWVHVDAPAPEAPEIVERRMGADADAPLFRPRHHVVHGVGVARMEAAGDARGLDDVQQRVIVADLEHPEALAHVGVQIDLIGHRDLLVLSAAPRAMVSSSGR